MFIHLILNYDNLLNINQWNYKNVLTCKNGFKEILNQNEYSSGDMKTWLE